MYAPPGFCPQARPDSCVAACCAMLLHHHEAPTDANITSTHDRLTAIFTLRAGVTHIGAEFDCWDASRDESFELLEAIVGVTWCAVVVMGGPWTHQLRVHRKLHSPHGILCDDREHALPHHAVVVTAWDPTGLSIFDPWFTGLDQPVRVRAPWLRQAWTGEVAYYPVL